MTCVAAWARVPLLGRKPTLEIMDGQHLAGTVSRRPDGWCHDLEAVSALTGQIVMMQAEINELRSQVGLQRAPLLGRQSLTLEAMEGQRIEIGRLQEECQQRTQTLEGMLASLSAHCAELGEDLGDLAAEAHASLKGLR